MFLGWLLISRVGVVVGFLNLVGGEVGIDLGRAQRLMAQQFLDDAEVGTIVEHVGGKAVSKRVGTDAGIQACLEEVLVEFASDRACRKALAVLVDEKGVLIEVGFSRVGITEGEVALDGLQGCRADGGKSFSFSFTADMEDLAEEVDVSEVEGDQFADAQARGVEGFHDGEVAGTEHGVGIG